MASITFLGTGGGRFVVLSQRRYSGGIWLDLGPRMVLDPGPGSLIRALSFGRNPAKLDAVIVSHRHIDHYNDAEIMLEAMTRGMKKKRGTLAINRDAAGYISDYHKEGVRLFMPEAGERFMINDLEVQAIPTAEHEGGLGFRFNSPLGTVTYASDTAYSEDLIKYYKDSRILILNTIFPASKEIEVHLNSRTAAEIIAKARPDLAVINHFGLTMLKAGPEKEAAWIQEKTGTRTIAARDGMEINLETLAAGRAGKKDDKQTRLA